MRVRNWLLAGTSLGFLALSPIVATQAQDLSSAYQALVDAQGSGDAAAADAAQAAFAEACLAAGYASVDECIAAATGAAPAPEAAPPPAPEPEATEAPAPEPEIIEPAPAPEPEAAPEPEPEPEVAPAPEPEPEIAPVPEPEPEVAPAPEPEVAPAPEPEPEVAPEPEPEVAPAPEPEAVAPVPDAEPAPQPEAPAEAPAANISGELGTAVDAYYAALQSAMNGGEMAAAMAAKANIDAICAAAGYASTEECLSANGYGALPAIPAVDTPTPEAPAPEAPAADAPAPTPDAPTAAPTPEAPTPDAPAPTPDTPAAPTPDAPAPTPDAPAPAPTPDAPAPSPDAPAPDAAPAPGDVVMEPIGQLPEGVTEEEVAPVLDSAKDEETAAPPAPDAPPGTEAPAPGTEAPAPGTEAPTAEAPPAPGPAPTSDAEAQGEAPPPPAPIQDVIAEVGEPIAPDAPMEVVVPPDAQVVEQTGNSFIFQIGTQIYINNSFAEQERLSYYDEDQVYYERLPNGRIREVIERPDGTRIITIRNANGDILRRSRVLPDGQEYLLAYVDENYDEEFIQFGDPGAGLPPLQLTIPVNEYVFDAAEGDEAQIQVFLSQPPVERVDRLYSIEEVKRSSRIRDIVRRLEVGNLTFDTGAATISRDQVGTLSALAEAINALLAVNPAETFLIEGHTDAVGSDVSNLALSDLRASTVARILTDFYDVPPENLVTQGYGERYLKVRTETSEELNRRVTVRRITPLITPSVALAN